MLKKEIQKTVILSILGSIIGITMYISGDYPHYYSLLMPFYAIGTFYGSLMIVKMLWSVTKTYFKAQMLSCFLSPLIGTVVSIILWAVGLTLVLFLGWIPGILKWLITLYTVYQEDNQ